MNHWTASPGEASEQESPCGVPMPGAAGSGGSAVIQQEKAKLEVESRRESSSPL